MFDYDLKGKQVILLIADEMVQRLRPFGVGGSPLLGRVHSVERHGLWLDAPDFSVCPLDGSGRSGGGKRGSCHAHLFIPGDAVLSAVAFPDGADEAVEQQGVHRIGFAPAEPH